MRNAKTGRGPPGYYEQPSVSRKLIWLLSGKNWPYRGISFHRTGPFRHSPGRLTERYFRSVRCSGTAVSLATDCGECNSTWHRASSEWRRGCNQSFYSKRTTSNRDRKRSDGRSAVRRRRTWAWLGEHQNTSGKTLRRARERHGLHCTEEPVSGFDWISSDHGVAGRFSRG
jgi:hypothetical protein